MTSLTNSPSVDKEVKEVVRMKTNFLRIRIKSDDKQKE